MCVGIGMYVGIWRMYVGICMCVGIGMYVGMCM